MAQLTDSQQADAGKVIKVGLAQLNHPTPNWINWIFRAILYTSGLFALISTQLPLTNIQVEHIDKWLLIGNTLVHFSTKFFGWDFKDN